MGAIGGCAADSRRSFSRASRFSAFALGHSAARAPASRFRPPALAPGKRSDDRGQPDPPLRLARTAPRGPHHVASRARGLELARAMLTALRYYWITAKGYRLRPWASPYI